MNSSLGAGHGSTLDSGAYTDLNRLNTLKVGKDRDSESNIHKVAQEFESLFLSEMMKAMRKANDVFAEGNFMNSNESKAYQDMYDQQLAVTMSKEQGVGLADVLERQLSGLHEPSSRANPFAQVSNQLTPTAPNAQALQSREVTAFTQPANASSAPTVQHLRDDSALINRRRLALPSSLSARQLAGISPSTNAASANAAALANAAANASVAGVVSNNSANASSSPAAFANVASNLSPAAYASLPIGSAAAQTDWVAAQSFAAPADKALSLPQSAQAAKTTFSSPADFVATMLPMAQAAAERIGVDAHYLVAQAALETGWGKSVIHQQDGSNSHNLFGIKSHNSWDGASARVQTTEYVAGKQVKEAASFRAYDSFEQSFDDYVNFLQSNGRYEKALNSTEDPQQFAQELQQAGYATDPQYARKIGQIARQMQTYQAVASVDSPRTRS
jgi:flagellar protein FlgJ